MLSKNRKIFTSFYSFLEDNPAFKLNGLLDSVNGAYWQWNLQEKTISWSPQAVELLGLAADREKLPQSEFLSIVYLKTLPRLLKAIEEAPKAHQIKKVEFSIQNTRGENQWFQMIIFPGFSQPEPDHLVFGVVLDISLSKRLEDDLNENKSLLTEAGQIAKFGAWEINLNTSEVHWSEQTYHIHEAPEDFVPTLDNAFDFYQGDSKEELNRAFQQLMDKGIPYKLELRLRTFRGRMIWVRVQSSPIFFNNELAKVRGFIQDITREKEYKERLQAQEKLFHSAFQYAPNGKALLKAGKVTVNEKLQEILGYEEAFYQQLDWNQITVSEDLEQEQPLQQAYQKGEIDHYSVEKRLIRKDGKAVWTQFYRTMVRDDAQQPMYELVQVEDIHQQKNLELEKNREINSLSMQNEQLNNFAHIVSHNLRSHSGNLEMLCYLYEREQESQEREELFGNIKKISEGLSTTIGHLSDMVKTMQDSNRKVQLITFQEVLDSTLQILYGQIEKSGVEIDADFTACPEIEYSPVYLDSIFLNLISNGIKYRSSARHPQIRIQSYLSDGRIHLVFQDNGLGIDLDKYGEKLFGLYKTFHGNSNAQGVGLFLTRNQVEAMGGKIRVQSKPDNGTTFTIMF